MLDQKMTDGKLLEEAARAAGYIGTVTEYPNGYAEMSLSNYFDPHGSNVWNPLVDDGAALRLAVKLGLRIDTPKYKGFGSSCGNVTVFRDGCPHAQTRRAIVMAAAEIAGK